jgi:polysaccharide export outer membrane protein
MGNITTRTTVLSILRLGLLMVCSLLAPTVLKAQQPPPGNYLLGPNDLVEVTVFQEDDLATKARVGNDGTITVPLVGSVKVGGKSVDEAAQIIRARLAKGYLVNPQVNVSVTEFSKRFVTVIGEVQKGGTFEFPNQGPLNLLQAIGLAGGYSKIADPKKVTVKRVVNGKEASITVDAKAMAGKSGSKIMEILPGDTVTVGESWL